MRANVVSPGGEAIQLIRLGDDAAELIVLPRLDATEGIASAERPAGQVGLNASDRGLEWAGAVGVGADLRDDSPIGVMAPTGAGTEWIGLAEASSGGVVDE